MNEYTAMAYHSILIRAYIFIVVPQRILTLSLPCVLMHLTKKFIPVLTVPFLLAFSLFIPPNSQDDPRLPPIQTGHLYVSNYNGHSISVYDSSGTFLRELTPEGLTNPRGVVFGPNNRFYIASQNSSTIFVFDENEEVITSFSNGELNGPTGMAISPNNELYVGSYSNDKVVVFDLDGNFLRSFGNENLNGTNCVAFDSSGNIYVSSAVTGTVLKFDSSETFLKTFTGGGLSSPMSIARDTEDQLYVSGGGSGNIVVFDTTGNFVREITHSDLSAPQGVAFDDRGHMFSSSFSRNLVVEFDANMEYVQTIRTGNLSTPRSIAFDPTELTPTSAPSFPEQASSFELHQSFPNPFLKDTTIRYHVPARGAYVSIELYDIQGRLVQTLQSGWQTEGLHEVTWDGLNLNHQSSGRGLYLYRLTSDDTVISKKLLRL